MLRTGGMPSRRLAGALTHYVACPAEVGDLGHNRLPRIANIVIRVLVSQVRNRSWFASEACQAFARPARR